MRAGGGAARGALAVALLRRCLLLGPLGMRPAGGQEGDGCGHTLLTPYSGTLSSKNYPGTYPNHTACRWRLHAPPGTSLLLAFGDVDLEPSERCAHSSLLLADPQADTTYGPFCRNAVPTAPLLVTNSSAMTVLFNSTSHRSGRGILLSYATSQHPACTAPRAARTSTGTSGATQARATGTGSLSEKRLIFHKACGDVLEVATFNASSWWLEVDALGQDRAWVAERAALGTAGHSWAAEPGSDSTWLELDLGARRNITGIITKGSSEQYDYYVTSYRVSSSRDGKNWRPYRGSSGQEDKVFEGNADSYGEVSNAFIPPIVARYIRVTPQSWHQRVALKVALVGCQPARVRAPRPYVPSVPKEVPIPTSRPASHTPIPGVALDPEKAGSTLLVMLLIGGFVLLCSSLLLLAFLCRRKRKPAAELSCGITKGYPKLESSPVCSLQSLPPPGSALASFPTAAVPADLSQTHSPEYAEPDLVQLSPSSQTGPSTFKPLLDEGYTLPLVMSHYDVPGKYHEYAEPLPPEPEYATPFSEPDGTRGITGLPCTPPVGYDAPTPRPGDRGTERTAGDVPSPEGAQLGDCPLSHVYHEAL
ncbi:discoidin, CUB and LCCL domain-containing protein 1-like isoform X2 [Rissa tridactyla]|uniref:discoidin, CUB and LCCL domain-containing protein 1-like isoform X2 n=1 Tax=Rissa tridactyla TaxID=75485 RepID=UPI0023BA6D25|nr:discoidin, CUB and LCCL domain-containing protein 1-like isoform X2 [Rissa tridactyla]